ncbi:site-specific integrase [Coleofasciculus sp. FACHB-129]|uniref:site-specific integrase n=1 Tax=Cyanophyceae TaxID=3028117 RepID=UPI001686D5F8|nr:site-specific integrase [Coleofasciculus sp. FACHB-129]MBD1893212.1 site-specific integrase [Coleofasciculus sp. FACHB-129]
MIFSTNRPETWADVYHLYTNDLKSTYPDRPYVAAPVQTAVIRYTIPKLGFILPHRKKLTQADVNAGLEFMKQIPISELNQALKYQSEVFASLGNVPSARTYRLHLEKMVDWCYQQAWWKLAIKKNGGDCCSSIRLQKGRVSDNVRVTDKKLTPSSPNFSYGLKLSDIFPELQASFDKLLRFQIDPVGNRKRQYGPLRKRSALGHVNSAKRLLGWLHHYKNVPLEALSLKLLVASSGLMSDGHRDENAIDEMMDLIDEHLRWLRETREASPNTELKVVESIVAVAKFLYHKESKCQSRHLVSNKRVGYRDIPIIEELRRLECDIMARVKTTPRKSDESKKWIDWPTFKACVEQLLAECAPRDNYGKKRSQMVLARNHQMALIFLLLSVFPDRGRTIRELEVGRTLMDRDGKWFIEHTAADFKTGDTYCKNGHKRIVELPSEVYPLLEAWLSQWRKVFKPTHNYVFSQPNGKPISEGALYNYVRKRVYRLTGQAFTPHMVRDSVVTYLKLSGTSDQVLAALAELMAHSQKMQRQVYDRRTPQQKVAPALIALQSLPTGSLPPPPPLSVKKP